jgi:hypothetical protein
MPTTSAASLEEAIRTLRRLEGEARDRGSLNRADQLDRIARDYEAELARRTPEGSPG